MRYVAAIGSLAREALGTQGKADSGFDVEVWNELTFGSNFLDINNYYDPKRQYAEPLTYRKTRVWTTALRPDARLDFEQKGLRVPAADDRGLLQRPRQRLSQRRRHQRLQQPVALELRVQPLGRAGGPEQALLHRLQLSGRASPEHPFAGKDHATVDALGHYDGKQQGREWHEIVPGTNFVPTFRSPFPEWSHSAFQTETIQRDLFPDSRRTNTPDWMGRYGRYTHNGDFQTPRYWQTETNYDRSDFIGRVKKEAGVKDDDPRLLAL